jgi:hypothetical protein
MGYRLSFARTQNGLLVDQLARFVSKFIVHSDHFRDCEDQVQRAGGSPFGILDNAVLALGILQFLTFF